MIKDGKKYCGSCSTWKDVVLFSKSTHTSDGYRNYCKSCKNKKDRERRKLKKLGLKSKNTDNQRRKTNLILYGTEHPMQNSNIQKKQENTTIELYGTSNYAKTEEFLVKRSKTLLDKYGVDNYFKHHEFQEKRKETIRKRYNKILPNVLDKWMLPNGRALVAYAKEYDKNITYCRFIYENFGFESLRNWVELDIRPSKTELEKKSEELFCLSYSAQKVGKYYPDFKLTDKIYIDVDGLYWHSSAIKENENYHQTKREEYEKKGMRLLQFREDEILEKGTIVKSMVSALLGDAISIYARKCKVIKVPWSVAKQFYIENHLQGAGTASTSYGLYYMDTLYAVLSFRHRNKEKHSIEISRFSNKCGYRVVGGFSKILSYVESSLSEVYNIYSFCDLRYSQGKMYESNGFVKVRESLGWSWTDFSRVYNRLQCKAGGGKTEAENAKDRGWTKIFDAGQRLYLKKLKQSIN